MVHVNMNVIVVMHGDFTDGMGMMVILSVKHDGGSDHDGNAVHCNGTDSGGKWDKSVMEIAKCDHGSIFEFYNSKYFGKPCIVMQNISNKNFYNSKTCVW